MRRDDPSSLPETLNRDRKNQLCNTCFGIRTLNIICPSLDTSLLHGPQAISGHQSESASPHSLPAGPDRLRLGAGWQCGRIAVSVPPYLGSYKVSDTDPEPQRAK